MRNHEGFQVWDALDASCDKAEIPRRFDTFYPELFFVTSPGLVVRSRFRKVILPFQEVVSSAPRRTYVSSVFKAEVVRSWRIQLNDYGQWPEECFTKAVDIAWLLNRQGSGEPGFLLKNRGNNLVLIARGVWVNITRLKNDTAWVIDYLSESDAFLLIRSRHERHRFICQVP